MIPLSPVQSSPDEPELPDYSRLASTLRDNSNSDKQDNINITPSSNTRPQKNQTTSRITRVGDTAQWTQSLAIRIECETIRRNHARRNIKFHCTVCKEITGPNSWRYREFLSNQQLRQHQGGKAHAKELRKKNFRENNYYCKVCKKHSTGPSAKHNYNKHIESRSHRRNQNNKHYKNSNIHK